MLKKKKTGGGWHAVRYTFRMASKVGWWRFWKAMRAKNACKTCALGMGGQAGGMVNEAGHFPEVCKKSFQAMVADMQAGLSPEFFRNFSIAQLQGLSPRELEWAGRIKDPVYAGPDDTHFRVISWDEAYDRLAKQYIDNPPDRTFFYASGRSSNEAGFLLQLFARLYGTNYVNNCSFYCHQASGTGLTDSLGTGTATVSLEDVEAADVFFLIGGNPASNHPRLMRTLMNIRRAKGHVIVINPVKEVGLINFSVPSSVTSLLFGSKIASQYVQPHIGGDIAVILGISKCVLERHAIAEEFIRDATEGFAEYAESVRNTTWAEIEANSGVDRPTIETMADTYCAAKNVVFGWTMGITHHEFGVNNVQMIVNLALLRGMIGRKEAGVLPIRGHSNIQGMGSVGVAPALKEHVLKNLEELLKVELPKTPGMDTMACMIAADEGKVDSAICLGGNLFGSNPDANFAHRALSKLDLITYMSTTLNTGHPWGRAKETLILPVLARDEEPEPTTQESMFNYVRLSDGQNKRLEGPRSEVEILCAIADRVLGSKGPIDWISMKSHRNIRAIIGKVIPGFEQMLSIDATKEEFHIGGRLIHTPVFPTKSGRAHFTVHPLPYMPQKADELRLMTVRSEGQFNTVVYEEQDVYRSQECRNVILMNVADIARLGLKIDQKVTVRSSVGAMSGILVREWDIRAGNALMYYPETNVLVPTGIDPRSKTPSFKCVMIALEADRPEVGTGLRNTFLRTSERARTPLATN